MTAADALGEAFFPNQSRNFSVEARALQRVTSSSGRLKGFLMLNTTVEIGDK